MKKDLTKWHPFFPLYPRQVNNGEYRVFQWIERKGIWGGMAYEGYSWTWEYRLPYKENNND